MAAPASTTPPEVITKVGSRRRTNFILAVFSLLLAAVFLFPLIWSFLISIEPRAQAAQGPPPWLPTGFSAANYQRLNAYGAGLSTYIWNTAAVSILSVIITTTVATLAGYGFARFRFPANKIIFATILAILVVPYPLMLIPLYTILAKVGLTNSLIGLSVIYSTYYLPFTVFMMRTSCESVPRELEESALVDGCTRLGALRRVVLRIVAPGIVTVILFVFLESWNQFLAPLIFLTDDTKYTLPVMLQGVSVGTLGQVDYGALQAGVSITMLPCIILFLALQRYYVSGLISGALKI